VEPLKVLNVGDIDSQESILPTKKKEKFETLRRISNFEYANL
jgi:hypothetical protein